MMNIKVFFFIVVLISFFNTSFSQDLKIFDKETLQPIKNVAIYSTDRKKSSISDVNGITSLDNFSMNDSVYFQHPTYKNIVLTKKQLKEIDYSIGLDKRTIMLDEFVISAYRWEQNKNEVPNKITTISEEKIEFYNPQTSADLLGNTKEVFIQKSQLGGGSPMIRGFATNSVLLVVDGVRMNNAIFRSGNLQNVISLDPHAIENSEVIFGPGSVTYGSDALGGVMDFHTKDVSLSTTTKPNLKVSAMARYSSANNEKTGHFDLNYGKQHWGILTSFSYSDFNDLFMGSYNHPGYKREEYADRINSRDTILNNDQPNRQRPSGYSQVNFMQKIRFRPSANLNLNYAFHYSTTSNIPRYDRLTQKKDGHLKNAEWYYGPQKWSMHSLNGKLVKKGAIFDNMKFTLAYQNYEESRHDRGFGEELLRHRTERLDIFNFNLDFDKEIGDDLLYYGLEYGYNDLNSSASEEDIITGEKQPTQTRYPNGQNDYTSLAAYLSYKNNIGEHFTAITGIRYSFIDIYSTLDTTAEYYNFPFNKLTLNTGAFNGSVGVVYRPDERWKFKLNGSSGFHAPNIDDIAKVFDSEPKSVVMPNENLKPEYAYNIDFGIDKRFGDVAGIYVTAFYTWLQNAMVRREATFNDKDSIYYDGVLSQVHKMVNAESARIYGFNARAMLDLPSGFRFETVINFTEGEDENGVPLRHVAPTFGQSTLSYRTDKIKTSLYAKYNGEITNDELTPSEQSKTHMYALNKNGEPYSPSWWTLNVKFSYQLNDFLTIDAGVENIMDVRYRPYSSGIVAPGRNWIFALRANF
jgi:hemoglobin/transferrin/lactoferrin receptor protein